MQAVEIVGDRQSAGVPFFLTRTQVARELGHDGSTNAMRNFVRRLEGRELHPVKRGGVWRFRRSEVEALARRSDFAHSARLTAAELEIRILDALDRLGDPVLAARECRVTIRSVLRLRDLVRRLDDEKREREKNTP